MTALTYDLEEAINGYWAYQGNNGWCSFKRSPPYAHWVIEAICNYNGQLFPHIIIPKNDNMGNDSIYTDWRPSLKHLQ